MGKTPPHDYHGWVGSLRISDCDGLSDNHTPAVRVSSSTGRDRLAETTPAGGIEGDGDASEAHDETGGPDL